MDKKTQKHILNILRKGTLSWHVRNECLKKASKKFPNGFTKKDTKKSKKGTQKWITKWRCVGCNDYHRAVEVDHIVEVGKFTGDIGDYAARMYCDASNLQVLCVKCHARKTSKFMSVKDKGMDLL